MNTYKNCRMLFATVLLIFFMARTASATLPDLANPIEPALFQGNVAQIMTYIKKKTKEVDAIKGELKQLISNVQKEEDKRILNDALDFFQALPILYMKLQSQLKVPGGLNLKLPVIGSPPYGLDVFYNLCNLLGKIESELSEYEPKIRMYENNLNSIKDELKSLLGDYIFLKQTSPAKLEAYLKLGQIYTQQVKYAISEVQLERARKILEKGNKLKSEVVNMLKTVFKHLKVTRKDVEKARSSYGKMSAQMDQQLALLGKRAVSLNKKIIPYEIRLNKVLAELKTIKSTEPRFALLKARKRFYEVAIETCQLELEDINQQKLWWKLSSVRDQFKYDWISTYSNAEGAKSIKEFLKEWSSSLDQIEGNNDALAQQLVDIRSQEYDLMRKITSLSDEKANAKDLSLSKILTSTFLKLKEASAAIDSLFVDVSKNKDLMDTIEREVSLVLALMKRKAGWIVNISAWSTQNLTKTWEDIKAVLYYPLVTIGNSAITLSSILKVIALLTTGTYLLRKGRRKLNDVLIKKTQLAPGTIGSITTLIYYSFLVLVVLVALSTAGINMNQLSIILGGLGVGIGFGLQNIANNFISGLILLIDRSIKVGDFVQLEDGLIGEVQNVAIRYAVVRTQDGEDIIVPNSEFVSQRVRNWTYGDNWRRLKIPFGVSYDADPDEVVKIATEAAREVPITVEDYRHPIRVRFEGFGDNSLNFFLKVWCRMTELRGEYGYISEYYFVLFRKFREAGIEIPFPQRDINIKHVSPEIIEKLSGKK